MRRRFAPVRFSWRSAALMWATACALLSVMPAVRVRAQAAPAAVAAPERKLTEVIQVAPGATCLELERLIARIERWRERDTVDARIRVKVQGDAGVANRVAFVVTKEGGASAERTLADAPSDCDQFHAAVALAIALSIDATLTDATAQHEATLPVPPPTAATPAATPKPQTLPPPQHKPVLQPDLSQPAAPMHLELAVLVGPGLRLFGDTTFLFAPRLTLTPWPWFALSLVGLVTHAGNQPIGTSRGHFEASLLAAGLDACIGGEAATDFTLFGCAGPRFGALVTTGGGLTNNFQDTSGWAALSGSGQARVWVTEDVGVGASVSLYFPFAQRFVRVAGVAGAQDQMSELPSLGIGIELGPVFRFY